MASENHLAESLVKAVAQVGAAATVIVIGGTNGAPPVTPDVTPALPPLPTPAVAAQDEGAALRVSDEMEKMRQDYERQLAALRSQLESAKQEVLTLGAQVQTFTASSQGGEITSLQNAQGETIFEKQPEEGTSVDEFKVDVIGLSEKIQKKVIKAGYPTVGKLREAFLDSVTLKTEAKLTKDETIEIGEKLLGKVPAERVPTVPSAAPTVSGVSDVPDGVEDRPWMKRLNVLLVKLKHMATHREKLADFEGGNKRFISRLNNSHKEYIDLCANVKVAEGQVVGALYSMGLDQSKPVQEAFESAGILNLLPEEHHQPAEDAEE